MNLIVWYCGCVHGCRWKCHNRNWPFQKDKSILSHVKTNWDEKNFVFHFVMILLPHSLEIYPAKSDACVQAKRDRMGCLSPGVCICSCFGIYLDSRMSLFIFRIIGFATLLLCQCIFDNKNLNKTAFPLFICSCPSCALRWHKQCFSRWYLWSRVSQQMQNIRAETPKKGGTCRGCRICGFLEFHHPD